MKTALRGGGGEVGGGIDQGERRRNNGTVADVRHLCDNGGVIAGGCSSSVKHLRTKMEAAGEKGRKSCH